MASLTIDKVVKTFGKTQVLKGIDLEIKDGELVILVGPSGCGKSTLLNCIAGLEEVTTGRIAIADTEVTHAAPKDRDIAMVFQSYALYPNMTVRKNIAFGLEIRKLPKADIEKEVNRVAELLQITHLLDRKPSQLSGGQRQRVAMGRALSRQPKVYLFDEPLSNLDAKLRVEMRTEIKKLHQRLATTIVYVTHDQIEAMTLADRIAVMKDGVLQQFASPQEVYDNPANIFVAGFMGSPSMNFIKCKIDQVDGKFVANISNGEAAYSLPIQNPPEALASAIGTEVIMGVRPEQITHSIPHMMDSEHTVIVPCKVEVTEPTGADTLVLVYLNGQEVNCRVHPAEAKSTGEMMDMMFNMEKAVFFNADTEARIL